MLPTSSNFSNSDICLNHLILVIQTFVFPIYRPALI